MMTRGHWVGATRLLAFGTLLTAALADRAATAGPATYDRDSKSFRLTYTFADLPGAGIGDQVVGAAYKPTPEEEQTVKALTALVSDVLFRATDGRGKVGRLDFVDDIKNADLVISRTGKPASPGWANRGAIDNQPGYVVLYYQSLVPFIKQDVVYTATHELCHYIFNLTDEYRPNLPIGCPVREGAACLMDNYYSSVRGYMGRFCNEAEHVKTRAQPISCQQMVDNFFNARQVSKDAGAVLAVSDPRQGLIETTIGKVKAKNLEAVANKKPLLGGLKAFAKTMLTGLVENFNGGSATKAIFTPDQLVKAVDLIVRAGTFIPAARPERLAEVLFTQIKAEATRIGANVQNEKSESTRASRIKSHLAKFVGEMLKQKVFAPADFPKDQQKEVIDRLARDEARSAQDKALDRFVGIGDVNVRMNREIASNIVDVLDELGAPGIAARRAVLRQFDDELKQFSIPGRTAASFGRRRTRFINPDPLDNSKYGMVLTQGGVFPYVAIRDRGFQEFSRLIDRERIELVEPRFQPENLVVGGLPLDVRIERPFEGAEASVDARVRAQRNISFQALLNDLFDQVQRDRLENVALLVPPGGLPSGVEQSLNVLRGKLPQGADVRLDIVLVGPTSIPTSLRDLSVRSRGSVLTITDLDEVGAIAQRLKNEQTSGSWLIVPQQGTIPQGIAPPSAADLGDQIATAKAIYAGGDTPMEGFADKFKGVRGPLNTAAGDVRKILRENRDGMTQQVRARVDEAVTHLEQMRLLFAKLDGDRAGYEPLIDAARAPVEEKNYPTRNTTYLRDIAAVKVELEATKGLIASAVVLPVSQDQPDQKADEANVAQADAAQALSAKITNSQLPESFGENLVNLDKLVRRHEKVLSAALVATNDNVPIFQRVDRKDLDTHRRQAESGANPKKPSPIDALTDLSPTSQRIRLARFYVEENAVGPDAELELLVGLSRPLPAVNIADGLPVMELYNDAGEPVGAGNLLPDLATTTSTLLVYRVQRPQGLEERGYTPFLRLSEETVNALQENDLNFTFSVGSTRRNLQLLASVVDDMADNTRGTLRTSSREAVVEVHVSAGSAVLGATVKGFCQKIVPGSDPITIESVEFKDEGQVVRAGLDAQAEIRDKAAGDGIYTGKVSLNGVTRASEFRIFIQADTTDGQAHFIALDDPNRGRPAHPNPNARADPAHPDAAAKSQADAEGPVLKFQRATSVHFRVEP